MQRYPLLILLIVCATTGWAERYAFLVGVKEYEPTELTSLEYTENDVTGLADALKQAGYPNENIVLMTQTVGAKKSRYLPVIKNIQKELLLVCSELGEDDTLLVAFAGHGVQFKGTTDIYFCPADAKLTDKATLLSLTKVYEILANVKVCKGKNKILLVDACRNDPQSRVSRAAKEIELEPAGIKERPIPPGGVAAFFSCSQGQKSFEHPDLQHGVFANFIIEAFSGKGDLDADGEISLAELEQYSVKATQKYARTVFGQAQTPERRGETRGLVTIASLSKLAPKPPADRLTSQAVGAELKLIPAGEFMMGNEASVDALLQTFPYAKREWFTDAESTHRVRITKPFYLGVHEVTVGQFKKFVNAQNYRTEAETDGKGGFGWDDAKGYVQDPKYTWKNPGFAQTDTHPVVNVSWNDAQRYLTWLSRQDGREYRLPTEAEWEYACRAGSQSAYSFGSNPEGLASVGNIADGTFADGQKNDRVISAKDGYKFTAPVGSFRANPFGLYDMHGNVFEWCADWYDADYYSTSPPSDPSGPNVGSYRVDRGGSWGNYASRARSAYRLGDTPGYRGFNLGFRLASSSVQ
jgi:formylglycine-generating enzyme required for sulfatase activity